MLFRFRPQQVPVLEETLRANTAEVLQEVAKHDMAEAIEHVVGGIEGAKDELQEAFLARDSGRTGALGGPAFKVQKTSWCEARQKIEQRNETDDHPGWTTGKCAGQLRDAVEEDGVGVTEQTCTYSVERLIKCSEIFTVGCSFFLTTP